MTAKTNYRVRMRTRCKDSSSLLSTGQKDASESDAVALRQMLMPAHMVGNHFKLTEKYTEKEESQNH